MLKKRRKRVRALNDELIQESNKADKADKPQRSPKIRFNLEGLPYPIKDRELLYEDYQESGSGMLEQWENRLQELRGNKDALKKELESKANSMQSIHLNRGPVTILCSSSSICLTNGLSRNTAERRHSLPVAPIANEYHSLPRSHC